MKNHIRLNLFLKKLWLFVCIVLLIVMTASCTETGGNTKKFDHDATEKSGKTEDIDYDATDPVEVVRADYLSWLKEDYTISMNVLNAEVDDAETQRQIERYKGSELAESRGWTDEYLDQHFIVVKVRYECEIDHTKTFLRDGLLKSYVFLTRDPESGVWTIVDRSSPSDIPETE